MPFHTFGPPHLHVLPIILTSALALAAAGYLATRKGVPAGLVRAGAKLKARVRGARSEGSRNTRQMFSTSLAARNSTGNGAFDDYRSATLTKLEQEAADFRTYLNELRNAKDKPEFDAFLNERRGKPADETSSP
jgi:hypothetical protein